MKENVDLTEKDKVLRRHPKLRPVYLIIMIILLLLGGYGIQYGINHPNDTFILGRIPKDSLISFSVGVLMLAWYIFLIVRYHSRMSTYHQIAYIEDTYNVMTHSDKVKVFIENYDEMCMCLTQFYKDKSRYVKYLGSLNLEAQKKQFQSNLCKAIARETTTIVAEAKDTLICSNAYARKLYINFTGDTKKTIVRSIKNEYGTKNILYSEDDSLNMRNKDDYASNHGIQETRASINTFNQIKYPQDCNEQDELFEAVGYFIIDNNKASIGTIRRSFKIGFNRAARILDQLEDAGVVGPEEGTRPRKVLMSSEMFKQFIDSGTIDNSPYQIIDSNSAINGCNDEKVTEDIKERDEAKIIEDALLQRFPEREIMFSTQNVMSLIKAGNCIIDKCSYDDPLDFCELVLTRCSPEDMRLILIDTAIKMYRIFDGLPTLLFPVADSREKAEYVMKWLEMEMGSRRDKQIKNGLRQYTDYYDSPVSEARPLPLVIIIREMIDIQGDPILLENLENILPVCNRFGIFIIAFSQYRYSDLRIGKMRDFFARKSADWMLSIFNDAIITNDADTDYCFDEMTGVLFEQFCAGLLEQSGYVNVKLTSQSNDYGGDVLAEKEQVKFVFQCKRYEGSVGINAVQEVMGSMSRYNSHVGVVFTNSYFTKQAVTLAQANNILLWDRDKLIHMINSVDNQRK